ncbi:hypothetical protein NKI12_29645 [Mesorhizobium australicum]|uniref:Uncharacterized protein n=1 Tax=Mesorhizobium australicum TaxID=536018 RepID=A0ACC6T7W6_9HYPH
MAKYQVEEIYGDTVVSLGIVVENDPMKAAEATPEPKGLAEGTAGPLVPGDR